MKPQFMIAPSIVSFFSGLFEMVALTLLVPTVQLLLSTDLEKMKTIRFLGVDISLFELIPFHQSRKEVFAVLLTCFGLVSLCRPLLDHLSIYLQGRVTSFLLLSVRRAALKNYLSYDKRFHDANGSGALASHILQYTSHLGLTLNTVNRSLTVVFCSVAYIGVMVQVSWKLTAFCFTFLPFTLFIQRRLTKLTAAASKAASSELGSTTRRVQDVLRCVSFVQVSNQEKVEHERVSVLSEKWSESERRVAERVHLGSTIHDLTTVLSGLVIIGVAALFFQRRGVEFGSGFMVFILAFRRFAGSIGAVSSINTSLTSVDAYSAILLRAVTRDDVYVPKDGTRAFDGKFKTIEFRNLRLSYGSRVALRGFSAAVEQGQLTGIIGPSGSGKSTILSVLVGLYPLNEGAIFIDGIDIREFTRESIRKNIGYISQETAIFDETLRFNLTYGLERQPTNNELFNAIEQAKLSKLFASLSTGFETMLGENGVRLSGGEKQRLAIARTILKDPPILLLDEATSALDRATEIDIQAALDRLSSGRTTLAVAHRANTLLDAKTVLKVEDGVCTATFQGNEQVRGVLMDIQRMAS